MLAIDVVHPCKSFDFNLQLLIKQLTLTKQYT